MKTKLYLICALALCVSALVACATPPPTATPVPPPDPASLIKDLVGALNAGNVDAAIAFFTDDATQTQTPPPSGTSGMRTGKEQIRGFYKGLLDDHFSVELSNVKVVGDKVTYTCTFTTDSYKKMGVAPLVTVEEAVFEKGKIKSQTINLSPESLAKIQAAMAAAQAKVATPTPIPPTSAPTLATPTPRPLPEGTLDLGNLFRTYSYYVPANLPRNAPLLIAFHGPTFAARMRYLTGYEFESLADQYGFIVVYPNGYQNAWNVCAKTATYPAKTNSIDDVGFVRALIAKFRADYGINPSQVFAMGFSLGGDMAYRLALELPDEITAVAAISANLPTDNNFDCRASGKPIPVLIMNGTRDFYNLYDGYAGFRSAQATVEYFVKLNGQTTPPKTTRLPHQDASDPTSVDRTVWNDAGKPEVIFYTINEGGFVIPQPKVDMSGLGKQTRDLDAPVEIWNFFARQPSLK